MDGEVGLEGWIRWRVMRLCGWEGMMMMMLLCRGVGSELCMVS